MTPTASGSRNDRGEEQGEEQVFRAFFRDTMLRAMTMQDPAPEATATGWPGQDTMLKTGSCSEILSWAAPALQQLRVLNLGRALRGKDAAYRLCGVMLGEARGLRELSLEWNEMGEGHIEHLAGALRSLTCLTSLDLGRNKLGANGARVVASSLPLLTNLTHLDLASNGIGAFGAPFIADALKKLPNLESLRLGYNWLGPEGAVHISRALPKLPNLQDLRMEVNRLGAEGAATLARGAASHAGLTRLCLAQNRTGAEGAAAVQSILQGATALEVDLSGNDLGLYGAAALVGGPGSPTKGGESQEAGLRGRSWTTGSSSAVAESGGGGRGVVSRGAHREGGVFLTEMAHVGNMSQIKALIERHGADVNLADSSGFTALHMAAQHGDLPLCRYLIAAGADLFPRAAHGLVPLHLAARAGQDKVIRLFAASEGFYREDLDIRTYDGLSCLHFAARGGRLDVTTLLLRETTRTESLTEVDINGVTSEGRTPLMLAADAGHEECVRLLLSEGSDTLVTSVEGYTALHLASVRGHDGVVSVIASHPGVLVDAVANGGVTSLHLVASEGHFEVGEVLLLHGAMPDLQDELGNTPADVAYLAGWGQFAEVLSRACGYLGSKGP